MEGSLLTILALGFILGIKHAMEPDHVIAVSTIASKSKNLWRASLAGVFWGIGHTTTLFIVGILLLLLKGKIPETWALSLECLVGIVLVYLGITNILSFKNTQSHSHQTHHYGISYLKASLVGLVHGLAGSAAMVLLAMSSVNNIWQGATYIFIFGTGTVVGMLLFTTIVGIPFVLSSKNKGVNKLLTQLTGLISAGFGLYYIFHIGVSGGLFVQWFH